MPTLPRHTKLTNVGYPINETIRIPHIYGEEIIDLVHIIDHTGTLTYLTTKTTSFPYETGPPTPHPTFPWNTLHDIDTTLTKTLKRINNTAEQITETSYDNGGFSRYVIPKLRLTHQAELHIYLPMSAVTGHEKTNHDIIHTRVIYLGIIR